MCWTSGSRKWRNRAYTGGASWCDMPMILSSLSKTATAASDCLTCWANVSVDSGSRSMKPRRAMWTSRRRRPYGRHWMASATTFDFLGFTHVWGRSMRGKDVVRQITAKGRFARALKSVHDWCKRYRHLPVKAQQDYLARVIRGHCAYFGLTGNSQTAIVVPLPSRPHLANVALTPQPPAGLELGPDERTPQAISSAASHDHALMATLLERTCQVRNRVRQSRTLGSVGGGAR